MIRRLRFKLIAATMLSLLLVLTIIMCALNIVNYRGIVQDADSVLELLRESEGRFPELPETFDWRIDGPRYKSPELPFEIRYFSVLLTADGTIEDTDLVQIAALDADAVSDYALRAWKSGRERGFVDDYRFLRCSEGEGVRIIFLDYGRTLASFQSVLISSVGISLAGLLAVLLLVIALSGRIMKPFAENYEKQKQFITDAGHEIKTPITIIDAAAEVLEAEWGENEWLRGIRQQAGRLTALTNDLIRLSRMEEERRRMIEFPLSELVYETASDFLPLAKAQDKELKLYIQSDIALRGDEDGIRQLISVLLDNALKYSPEGSAIILRLERHGKSVSLQIENVSTQPLTREHMERMFNRFYRGDSSRSSKTSGYGIGLSIAKAVVNEHRGRIGAASPDGKRLMISIGFPG
ncbi:MAG: sensor histidine kinase [Candidatus Faecivicinus sp.]